MKNKTDKESFFKHLSKRDVEKIYQSAMKRSAQLKKGQGEDQ